jgi:ferredoxin
MLNLYKNSYNYSYSEINTVGGMNIADNSDKVVENVEGPYYCDYSCIACHLCVDTSPENFKMTDDDSNAFVYKQPENDEEKTACEEALEACPVNAIGNDG